jgi:hypothetical protein
VYQTRRSTVEEIHEWFKDESRNIAIVYGEISGAVCVDADSPEAISYWVLTATPTPFRINTRKGRHFIYRHPGGHIRSITKALVDPPIDIKADGGIATAIGSTRDGFRYSLDAGADIFAPADLPVFQREWLSRHDMPISHSMPYIPMGSDRERAERYMAKVQGSMSGCRNADAFKLAIKLRKDFHLDIQGIEELLSMWNLRCDPPLPEVELKAVLKSRSLM